MEQVIFYLLGGVSVILSLVMISARKPVTSAISLIGVMFCLAGLFAAQNAHLIAALQILVYAGAIMVLFLFVIMLMNLREKSGREHGMSSVAQFAAVAALCAIFVPIVTSYDPKSSPPPWEVMTDFGTTGAIGRLLFTEFLLPFEVASVLLLAALVGAVILTKTRMK